MHPSTYEYLKPTDDQIEKMARVRAAAKAYSDVLDAELPEGPDKTFVIRAHRSNAMWANVAITRLPDGTPRPPHPGAGEGGMSEPLKVLDLFSGIGGFSLGLERTGGFKTVAFCEIEEFPRRVLAKHWPDVPIHRDVRELKAEHVGAVDVICGGFPCQDISTAGKGAGLAGERSGLWREYARLVGEIRPDYVIVENVAALLGRGLGTVLGDLAALGYDAEWHCIPASSVGAPHIRDRIWIIAYPQHSAADGAGSYRAPQYVDGDVEPAYKQVRFARSLGAFLADAASERRGEAGQHRGRPAQWSTGGGEALAYPIRVHVEGEFSRVADQENRSGSIQRSLGPRRDGIRWWATEPDVGRVAHGVPARVDRLRGLGNAVVPQIPEIIGRAILAARAA